MQAKLSDAIVLAQYLKSNKLKQVIGVVLTQRDYETLTHYFWGYPNGQFFVDNSLADRPVVDPKELNDPFVEIKEESLSRADLIEELMLDALLDEISHKKNVKNYASRNGVVKAYGVEGIAIGDTLSVQRDSDGHTLVIVKEIASGKVFSEEYGDITDLLDNASYPSNERMWSMNQKRQFIKFCDPGKAYRTW